MSTSYQLKLLELSSDEIELLRVGDSSKGDASQGKLPSLAIFQDTVGANFCNFMAVASWLQRQDIDRTRTLPELGRISA